MIQKSADGKQRVLSLSYGKDSLACLGAIEELGWPLDRIVHAEVWFDDDTPADLPPMVEFKAKADAIIKERYGIEVEHVFAIRGGEGHIHKEILLRTLLHKLQDCAKRQRLNLRIPCQMRRVVQPPQG